MSVPIREVVNTAVGVSGHVAMGSVASGMLKKTWDGSRTIPVYMTASQLRLVEQLCSNVPIKVDGTVKQVPHPLSYTFRHFAREDIQRMAGFNIPGKDICCLGSGSYEVSAFWRYDGTPVKRGVDAQETARVTFQVHAREAKDAARLGDGVDAVLRQMEPAAANVLGQKLRKAANGENTSPQAMAAKLGFTVCAASAAAGRDASPRVYFGRGKHDYPRCDTVVCFDVGYGFTEEDWAKVFERTGCSTAYVTMIVPWELHFPDMPDHSIYKFVRGGNGSAETGIMVFRDETTGYEHELAAWGTLVNKHFIRLSGAFAQVEVVASYGPQRVFRLSRVNEAGPMCGARLLSVPELFRYVRVMDVSASLRPCGEFGVPVYRSYRLAEVFGLLNHLLAVKANAMADEAVSVSYAMSYINKMRNGMLFGGVQALKAWDMPQAECEKVAVACMAYVALNTDVRAKAIAACKAGSTEWRRRRAQLIHGGLNFVSFGLYEYVLLFTVPDLAAKIVVEPEQERLVTQRVVESWAMQHPEVVFDEGPSSFSPEDGSDCGDGAARCHRVGCGGDCGEESESECSSEESRSTWTPDAKPLKSCLKSPQCEARRLLAVPADDKDFTCHCCDGELPTHTWEIPEDRRREFRARMEEEVQGMEKDSRLYQLYDNMRTVFDAKAADSYDCKLLVVCAGPGAGKTYAAKRAISLQDMYVVGLSDIRSEFEAEVGERCLNGCRGPCTDPEHLRLNMGQEGRIKTQHYAFKADFDVQTLFVDEAMGLCFDLITLLVLKLRPKAVVLLGDPQQYCCESRHGTNFFVGLGLPDSGDPAEAFLESCTHHRMVGNWRNPRPVVRWMNRAGFMEMHARSEYSGPAVRIMSHTQFFEAGFAFGKLPYMAASERTCRHNEQYHDEAKMRPCTVRSRQGRSFKSAVWHITLADLNHLQQLRSCLLVAMTRCRETLYIVHDGSNGVRDWMVAAGLEADNFTDLIAPLGGGPTCAEAVTFQELRDTALKPEVLVNGEDAYLMAPELVPGQLSVPDISPLNMPASEIGRPECVRLEIEPDAYVAPTTARGNPQALGSKTRALTTPLGRMYMEGNPAQTSNTAAKRYSARSQEMGPGGKELAEEIVRVYFGRCVSGSLEPSEEDIAVVVNKVFRDFRAKGADKAVNGKETTEKDFDKVVRFHLKTIVKPDTSKTIAEIDVAKVGQGISAWGKEPTLRFAVLARYIERMMCKAQRKDDEVTILTDDGVSEEDFIKAVNAAAARQRERVPGSKSSTTDGVEFDSQQGEFTQELGKCLMRRFDIPEEEIEAYYSFRRKYLIKAQGFTVRADAQKTSGEPWTKGENGWVARVLSFYLLGGDEMSSFVMTYKGDDFWIYGLARYDASRRDKVEAHTALQIKINSEDLNLMGSVPRKVFPDFCGLCLVNGVALPSVVRRFLSAISRPFRGYEHFAEYQQSLRNFVGLIGRLEAEFGWSCVTADAIRLGLPTELVRAALECLNSLSHINERQFSRSFHEWVHVPAWLGGLPGQPVLVYAYDNVEPRLRGDTEGLRRVADEQTADEALVWASRRSNFERDNVSRAVERVRKQRVYESFAMTYGCEGGRARGGGTSHVGEKLASMGRAVLSGLDGFGRTNALAGGAMVSRGQLF